MVENFDIIEKNVGDIKVIKVIGELDALVAPKLKERITKLVEMDTTKFIIDFEELVHINSLAMGILRGKLRVVKEIGGDIKGETVDLDLASYYNYFFMTKKYANAPDMNLEGFYQFNYSPLGIYRFDN